MADTLEYADMVEANLPVCPQCNGRGICETGEMENEPGGWGYQSVECDLCHGH